MSQRDEAIQIILGIGLVFGMHGAAITIGTIASVILSSVTAGLPSASFISTILHNLGNVLITAFLAIGLAQAIYVVPAIVVLSRRQQWGLMKGVIIGAVITALLNGGCWLLIVSFFSLFIKK
jgi:hypothetical protein